MNPRCTRRKLLGGAAAIAGLGVLAFGSGRLAAQALQAAQAASAPQGLPAGPAQGFESVDLDWLDPARDRPVPVRLHLPAGADATQPAPLVVVSHGIGGSRRGYTWLGHDLARHGVASLHLQHVGSDRALWSGNPLALVGRLQEAARADEALARALDWRFAVDTLLASPWGARLDTRRIVAAGHSYGANTTLLVAGARVPGSLADPRVRAAVLISAPPLYGEAEPARVLGGVQLPTLHVTATEDVIRIPGYWSGFEDRLQVYEQVGSADKWLAVYAGGSHSMFTDRAGTGGALNPQAKAATRELVRAFLRQVFEGDGAGLAVWPQRHAGILARFDAA